MVNVYYNHCKHRLFPIILYRVISLIRPILAVKVSLPVEIFKFKAFGRSTLQTLPYMVKSQLGRSRHRELPWVSRTQDIISIYKFYGRLSLWIWGEQHQIYAVLDLHNVKFNRGNWYWWHLAVICWQSERKCADKGNVIREVTRTHILPMTLTTDDTDHWLSIYLFYRWVRWLVYWWRAVLIITWLLISRIIHLFSSL